MPTEALAAALICLAESEIRFPRPLYSKHFRMVLISEFAIFSAEANVFKIFM